MDPVVTASVALVTGAGSGIGQEIAVQCAVKGATKLFLVDLSMKGLLTTQELVKKGFPEAKIVLHEADVSDEASVRGMVNKCVEVFGRLDLACNNAGVGTSNVKTTDMDVAMFDRICNVNEKGVYLCEKYEIEQMLSQGFLPGTHQRGAIVNTASLCGLAGIGTLAAYNGSKHAVAVLTRVDARQYAADGIRINAVCPGFVETPMFVGSGLTPEYVKAAESQCPMNRLLKPAEIAHGVLFLLGSGASAITGINLPIDGGALLYHII